jgi:hypothetical protein
MNSIPKRLINALALTALAVFSSTAQTPVPLSQCIQAEDFSAMQGATFGPPQDREPRLGVGNCGQGDWVRFDSVNFMNGEYDSLDLNCWTVWEIPGAGVRHWFTNGSSAAVRVDAANGPALATIPLASTPLFGYEPSTRFKTAITLTTGIHSVFLTFAGADTVCQVDKFCLRGHATANSADAHAYYVSASTGSDANDGLSLDRPFRTIRKAALIMKPGATCYVRQGIYRETVRPAFTGLPGAPLTFRNYGNEDVFISGADSIKGWSVHSGNIWKAPMNWTMGRYSDQLLVDGKMAVTARMPDIDRKWSPWPDWVLLYPAGVCDWTPWRDSIDQMLIPTRIPIDNNGTQWPAGAHTAATDFGISQSFAPHLLPSELFGKPADFFKGAMVKLQNDWYSSDAVINGSASTADRTVLTCTAMSSMRVNWNGQGWIWGGMNLLDAPNEWLRVDSTAYLYPPNGTSPSAHLIEAKRRAVGFDATGKQYVNLTGIKFIATSARFEDAWYCTIDRCEFKYISHYDTHEWWDNAAGYFGTPLDPSSGDRGVYVSGGYNTIKNSLFAVSAANGIVLEGQRHTVANCRIRDIDYDVTYFAGIFINKRDNADKNDAIGMAVTHNTIYNCGRSTINFHASGDNDVPANRHIIQYNDLGRMGWECSEVTSIGADGALWNLDVSYNWFHDVCGFTTAYVGIDPGWGDHAWFVHHNVFWQGNPINKGTAAGFTGANLMLDWRDTGRSGTLSFQNTIIDTILPPHRDVVDTAWPGIALNNLWAKSDTAPWKFTDAKNRDYSLRAGSPAIDKGVVLPGWLATTAGISPTYDGTAPDLGAYEFGQPRWTAGADWLETPWHYPPVLLIANTGGNGASSSMARSALFRSMPGRLMISIPAGMDGRVTMHDAQGRMIAELRLARGGQAELPTAGFSPGIYAMRISWGDRSMVRKIGIWR